MKRVSVKKRFRTITLGGIQLYTAMLTIFFLAGALVAYFYATYSAQETNIELQQYIDNYLSCESRQSVEMLCATAVSYFRMPLLAFLLGFAAFGLVLLPILCTAQGFFLSFSLFSFSAALGRENFLCVLALFSIRLLIVVPCTLLLSAVSMSESGNIAAATLGSGRRSQGMTERRKTWLYFCLVCFCLCIGALLELRLVPLLLAGAAAG